jgi:quinol monooxygenase YgiN
MAKVQVIARFAAREGSENQLAALLQSMLAPTRAELGVRNVRTLRVRLERTLLSLRSMGK